MITAPLFNQPPMARNRTLLAAKEAQPGNHLGCRVSQLER